MKNMKLLSSIIFGLILSACATNYESSTANLPINMIPMYGYPTIEKTVAQKKSDEIFIATVIRNSGSRENGSNKFAGEGWRSFSAGDNATAMRRFNQAWLLNPNNYLVQWGFGAILWAQGKTDEAIIYYDNALSSIDDNEEKPRLLTDAARAYSKKGFIEIDKLTSKKSYLKANSLFDEALILNPHYDNAYNNWARSLYLEGNYEKAWDVVKRSRKLGGRDISRDFIDALSKKMPEPN